MNARPDSSASPSGPYAPLWRAIDGFDHALRELERDVRALTDCYTRQREVPREGQAAPVARSARPERLMG